MFRNTPSTRHYLAITITAALALSAGWVGPFLSAAQAETRYHQRIQSKKKVMAKAEALWTQAHAIKDLQRARPVWERATTAFRIVAGDLEVPMAVRRDAAWGAVLSLKNASIGAEAVERIDPQGVKITPMGVAAKAMLMVLEEYMAIADPKDPDHPNTVIVRYFIAQLRWRHDDLDPTIPVLMEIVTKHPRSQITPDASDFLIDALHRRGRHVELLQYLETSLITPELVKGRPALAARLVDVHVAILHEAGDRLAQESDFRGCAASHLVTFARYPKHAKVDAVLYDAAGCYKAAGSYIEAIATLRKLMELFPKSELIPKAERALRELGAPLKP